MPLQAFVELFAFSILSPSYVLIFFQVSNHGLHSKNKMTTIHIPNCYNLYCGGSHGIQLLLKHQVITLSAKIERKRITGQI